MGKLRVISGKARGIRLHSVPGDTTRPITDRTKESLFNIIGSDISDSSFLDLFAGTGAVGIEALSRGAKFVRFIDNNHRAISTIKKNLEITKLSSGDGNQHTQILQMDAFSHLADHPDQEFDYIYIAPPQYKGLWLKSLQVIALNPGWLSSDAWIIVQIHPVEYSNDKVNTLNLFDQRKYGSTLLLFYERDNPA